MVTEIAATASQQAQAEEIHELRRQAAAHRSALQLHSEDPLLRQLEDVITSKDRWRQVTAAGAVSSSTKLYLDRRESASDYLDRWLLLDSGSSSAAALGEAPRTAAASRAGDSAQVADDVHRTVSANLQTDSTSSSSPNPRMEIRGRSADQLNALQRQGLNVLRDEAEEERMMPNRLQPSLQQYPPHQNPLLHPSIIVKLLI